MPSPRIQTHAAVHPRWAIEGGRVRVDGQFDLGAPELPEVRIGGTSARVVHASSHALTVLVPPDVAPGRVAIEIDGMSDEAFSVVIGNRVATGLHQVDSPAFGPDGSLYVAYSGTRGQQSPVSLFRVRPDGVRENLASAIVNPTSMTFDSQGRLYVSSRFEGTVYRVDPEGDAEVVATELGVACGLAFGADSSLFIGDRSGTIFRLTPSGHVIPFVTLPPSVAAYHLAMGPDDHLYVTAPTLSPRDVVYRISLTGTVEVFYRGFGRPQGLAFGADGTLYVIEALAGATGLYGLKNGSAELALTGKDLVGVAMDPSGGLVVASSEAVYRLDVDVQAPPRRAPSNPGEN